MAAGRGPWSAAFQRAGALVKSRLLFLSYPSRRPSRSSHLVSGEDCSSFGWGGHYSAGGIFACAVAYIRWLASSHGAIAHCGHMHCRIGDFYLCDALATGDPWKAAWDGSGIHHASELQARRAKNQTQKPWDYSWRKRTNLKTSLLLRNAYCQSPKQRSTGIKEWQKGKDRKHTPKKTSARGVSRVSGDGA